MGLLDLGDQERAGGVRVAGENFELSVPAYAVWSAGRFAPADGDLHDLDLEADDPAQVADELAGSGLLVRWAEDVAQAERDGRLRELRPVAAGAAIGPGGGPGTHQLGTVTLEPRLEVIAEAFALWLAFDGRRSVEGACVEAAASTGRSEEELRPLAWALLPVLCGAGLLALDRVSPLPA